MMFCSVTINGIDRLHDHRWMTHADRRLSVMSLTCLGPTKLERVIDNIRQWKDQKAQQANDTCQTCRYALDDQSQIGSLKAGCSIFQMSSISLPRPASSEL